MSAFLYNFSETLERKTWDTSIIKKKEWVELSTSFCTSIDRLKLIDDIRFQNSRNVKLQRYSSSWRWIRSSAVFSWIDQSGKKTGRTWLVSTAVKGKWARSSSSIRRELLSLQAGFFQGPVILYFYFQLPRSVKDSVERNQALWYDRRWKRYGTHTMGGEQSNEKLRSTEGNFQ